MDFATLIGFIGGFTIVLIAIFLGGKFGIFVDIPSAFIVIGGTAFVVAMKFSVAQLTQAVTITFKAFFYKLQKPEEIIETMLELGTLAQKGGGVLALEKVEIKDPFLRDGVAMLVDGFDPSIVRRRLETAKDQAVARHQEGQRIFKAMADVGPAMGMIGTLVGLVQMLSNMDDPKTIGPAMALALLTTLYGALIANLFASPVADKLALRSDEEETNQALMIDGLMDIQAGINPRVMAESLQNYLPVTKRIDRSAA